MAFQACYLPPFPTLFYFPCCGAYRLGTPFRDSRGLTGRCVPVKSVSFGFPSVPSRGLTDCCVLVRGRALLFLCADQ